MFWQFSGAINGLMSMDLFTRKTFGVPSWDDDLHQQIEAAQEQGWIDDCNDPPPAKAVIQCGNGCPKQSRIQVVGHKFVVYKVLVDSSALG